MYIQTYEQTSSVIIRLNNKKATWGDQTILRFNKLFLIPVNEYNIVLYDQIEGIIWDDDIQW